MPIFRRNYEAQLQVSPEVMGQFLQNMLVDPTEAALQGIGNTIAIRDFREDDQDDKHYLGGRALVLRHPFEITLRAIERTHARADIDTKRSTRIHVYDADIALAGLRLPRSETQSDDELKLCSSYYSSHNEPVDKSMLFMAESNQSPSILSGRLTLWRSRKGDGWVGATPRSHRGTHY